MNLFNRFWPKKPTIPDSVKPAYIKAYVPRIHTHPDLERQLGLDGQHVIIDREAFQWLVANSEAVVEEYSNKIYTKTYQALCSKEEYEELQRLVERDLHSIKHENPNGSRPEELLERIKDFGNIPTASWIPTAIQDATNSYEESKSLQERLTEKQAKLWRNTTKCIGCPGYESIKKCLENKCPVLSTTLNSKLSQEEFRKSFFPSLDPVITPKEPKLAINKFLELEACKTCAAHTSKEKCYSILCSASIK